MSKRFYFCYHNNVEFIHLFDEERYTKTTELSDSEWLFTWSYYECPLCHQILIFRKDADNE